MGSTYNPSIWLNLRLFSFSRRMITTNQPGKKWKFISSRWWHVYRKMYREHLEWPSALNCLDSFPFSLFLSLFFVLFRRCDVWWFVIGKFNDAPGECIYKNGGLLLQLFFFKVLYIRINFQWGGRWRDQGVKIGVNDVDGPPHPWIHQISKRGSSTSG